MKTKYILAICLFWLLVAISYFAAPWPVMMRTANIGSHSFSFGWQTRGATMSCVALFKQSFLPIYVRTVCDDSAAQVHLVTFNELQENQTYRLMVFQGWRMYLSSIRSAKTYVTAPNPIMPNPAYGSVVDYKGNPVPNALVYVYPRVSGAVYPEATRTNDQGNFAIDLGFYGTGIEQWIVEGGSGPDQWNARVIPNLLTPMPTLEVNAL